MRLLRRLFLLCALLGIVLVVDAARVLHAPLRLEGDATFVIEPGMSFASIAERLESRGWLASAPRSTLYLRVYARLNALERRLHAGEFRLSPEMTPLQALYLFVSGRTVLHELRIVEGWTFAQAVAAVRDNTILRHTLVDREPATIMAALGRGGEHPEGRLFPDTYRFARGTSDIEFLRRAADTMDRVLAEEWERRAEGLPYADPAQALTMASIVEKETGAPDERARIAGVFVRRLRLGMRLQTDPTIIYGLGESFDGNLRKRDLVTDGEYNTYLRAGLPPTPICLPGRAAINAALHPADGKALFFVSRGDGTHEFSETLEQHEAAVQRYQLRRN